MKSIVLVEDDRDSRLLVRSLLSEFYKVIEYETGFEALLGLRDLAPDLVILDVSLPGMSGPELLRRLRTDKRLENVPVIALTAHASTSDREEYLQAGFDGYVAKPIVDDEAFLQAVKGWLNQRRRTAMSSEA